MRKASEDGLCEQAKPVNRFFATVAVASGLPGALFVNPQAMYDGLFPKIGGPNIDPQNAIILIWGRPKVP